jgi:glycerate 2-kinase
LTTTIGTGELIREALSHPIEHLIVTIGGSATNDCGAGMLQASGPSILDDTYQPVRPTGGNLSDVSFVDLSGLDPRLKKIKLSIACDVTNPLVGPNGASYVFGPQKGATPEMVQLLDQNIKHFADVIQAQTGIALHDVPGGGAAGGLGAALFLCGGAMIQGIDLVLDVLSFDHHLNEVDYVFTGEGRIDHQTSFGKVIAGIVRRASKQSVPVIAFAGSVRRGVEVLYEQGLLAAYSITPTPCTLEEALRQGKENLYRTAVNIMRLIRYTST